ncbi:MAG: hypothetical protein ISP01_04330 [Methanobrevibacter arboriphilus]|uniref:Uncharacterized protein n=1 Tax=Methanobrevibacter arboriphilus TaxID=39441 RepID=A0A843AP84_METAZ|nr:hypothetical protein [Methanobrevibacter arboriphilus]MBF4468610.1 hypothetical protein [Methanobrevibacter arboriphilus]
MANIGLTFYEIEIDDVKNNSRNYSAVDYLDLISDIFHETKKSMGPDTNDEGKIIYENIVTPNKRLELSYFKHKFSTISGIVNYYSIDNYQENHFEPKNLEDISPYIQYFKPYYFLLEYDKHKDKIYLILEKKGIIGIKTIFINFLNDLFKKNQKYGDIKLKAKPMTPSKLLNKYISEGNIVSVIYYNNDIKKQIFGDIDEISCDIKTEIRIKEKNFSPQQFLEKSKQFFKPYGENYDDISFKTELYGKIRNIYIKSPEKFSPYIEITDNIRFDYKGNPTFESIDNEAIKVAKAHYGIILDNKSIFNF